MTWTDEVKPIALQALRWLVGAIVTAVGVVMIFKTDIPKWGVGVGVCGLYFMLPTDVQAFFTWAVNAVGSLIKPKGAA